MDGPEVFVILGDPHAELLSSGFDPREHTFFVGGDNSAVEATRHGTVDAFVHAILASAAAGEVAEIDWLGAGLHRSLLLPREIRRRGRD